MNLSPIILRRLKRFGGLFLPFLSLVLLGYLLFGGQLVGRAQLDDDVVKQTVVILVQESLLESDERFGGLASEYSALRNVNLANRIDRYAKDIQATLPQTETVILPIPQTASALNIHQLLQRLTLFSSDQLVAPPVGVVLVGDLPLPTVENNGVNQVSVYPYTDFLDTRYVWDALSESFVLRQETSKPELWHGLIKFEQEVDYAIYFDKNHLTKIGHEDFTAKRRIFFSDLPDEQVSLNEDLLPAYANFISVSKQRSYQHYTSDLLRILANRFNSGFNDVDLTRLSEEIADVASGSGDLADTYVKQQIESFSRPFITLFSGYYSRILPIIEQTGRYRNERNEITTVPQQVSYVDERQEQLFKAVNSRVEKLVDDIVEEVAQPARLFAAIELTGTAKLKNGQTINLSRQLFFNHRSRTAVTVSELVSHAKAPGGVAGTVTKFNRGLASIIVAVQELDPVFGTNGTLLATSVSLTENSLSQALAQSSLYINSQPVTKISTAEQCRFQRGQKADQQVVTSRNFSINQSSEPAQCYLPWASGEENRWLKDKFKCDQFNGIELLDEHRLTKVVNGDDALTTHESCYAFRSPTTYFRTELGEVPFDQVDNPANIVLSDSLNLDLATALKAINSDLDLNSQSAWSAALANLPNDKITLTGEDLGLTDVAELTLKTNIIGESKTVSSVIDHKDPIPEVLNRQFTEGISRNLPIDGKRYISFVNRRGQAEYLFYPDLFAAGSFSNYLEELKKVETRLSQLSRQNYRGYLTKVVNEELTDWDEDFENVTTVNENELRNFLNWQVSDLQTKYQLAFQLGLQGLNSWGQLNEAGTYEVAVLNLPFNDSETPDTLAFDLPKIVADSNLGSLENLTTANNDLTESDEEDEADLGEARTFTASELEATANCNQYYTARGMVRFLDYASYLDCWFTNEVQTSINQLVDLPSLKLPEVANPLPPQNQVVSSLEINALDQFVNSSNKQKVTVKVLNSAGQVVSGQVININLKVSGAAKIAGSSLQTTTSGQSEFEIELTKNKGVVKLEASLLDLTVRKNIQVVEPYNVSLTGANFRAGSENAQLEIKVTNPSVDQTLLKEIKIDSEGIPSLNGTFALENGMLLINPALPTKSGRYPLKINLAGNTVQRSVLVKPAELAKVETASKTVSKFDRKVVVNFFDRFGNKVDDRLIRGSLANNNQSITFSQTNFRTENGSIELPFSSSQSGVYQLTLDIEGFAEPYLLNLIVTEQLSFEQLKGLSPAAQHLQLHSNLNNEAAGEWVSQWLLNGKAQTIAVTPQTETYQQLYNIAGSNTVGEAYSANQDDSLIVWGDPTFKLPANTTSNVRGFSADLGEVIADLPAPIAHIATNDDTLALATTEGEIYLLQDDSLELLTSIPLGVRKLVWWKPERRASNAVLLVVTEDVCSELEGCLFAIYFDDNGRLRQESVPIKTNGKITNLLVDDLSDDREDDLLVVNEAQNLLLFLNSEGVNDTFQNWVNYEPVRIASLAAEANPERNLSKYFLWHQPGYTPSESEQIVENTSNYNKVINGKIYRTLNQVNQLKTSTVSVRDVNGQRIEAGELLEYNILLTNVGQQPVNGSLALPVAGEYRVQLDSVSCPNCSIQNEQSDQYPYRIDGISVQSGQTLNITFRAKLERLPDQTSHLSIVTDADGYPADGKADIRVVNRGSGIITYLYSTQNDRGQIVYRRQEVAQSTATATGQAADLLQTNRTAQQALQNGNIDSLRAQAEADYQSTLRADKDGNDILDSLESTTGKAHKIADKVNSLIEDIFCSGGCIATPVNHAFLVDGWGIPGSGPAVPVIAISKLPPFFQPGIAAGSVFRQYLSPTLTGELGLATCYGLYPFGSCHAFRVGLLEHFGDICADINNSIISAFNVAQDVVYNAISGEVGDGQFGIVVGAEGSVGNTQTPTGISTSVNVDVPGFPEILTNWLEAQRREITKLTDLPDLTVIYPDFSGYFDSLRQEADDLPSQAESQDNNEIPENETVGEQVERYSKNYQKFFSDLETDLDGLNSLYTEIGAYSMLKIEIENYEIQYPYLPPELIHNFMVDYAEWKNQLEREVDQTLTSWGCYANGFPEVINSLGGPESLSGLPITEKLARLLKNAGELSIEKRQDPKNYCYQLLLTYGGISADFNANLEILAEYLSLPSIIFTVDNWRDKLLAGVIEIVDNVNKNIVGYLNTTTKRIEAWDQMLKDLQRVWKQFSLLVNLSLDYLKQCDDCRTHRYSDYSLLIDLFVDSPELPVFALPKWPDITLDFSDIRAGATITVPEFSFVPKPITLPTLPRINLPDSPPISFLTQLPEFGLFLGVRLPDPPDLPDILEKVELPDLFNIEIPKLPLIPLPPDIGSFGAEYEALVASSLELVSKVLRIICILEQGLIPVPETFLKQKIEQLTARPLNPPLPIDIEAGIGFKLPLPESIGAYLSKVTVKTHILLDIEADPLSFVIQPLVDYINGHTTDFSSSWNEQVNKITNLLNVQKIIDDLVDSAGNFKEIDSLELEYSPNEQQLFKDLDIDLSSGLQRLYAQAGPVVPAVLADQPAGDIASVLAPGIYINDGETEQAMRLVDYQPEVASDTHLSFIDFDGDGDADVVYNVDNKLYLKRNSTQEVDPFYNDEDPVSANFDDLMSETTPVQNQQVTELAAQVDSDIINLTIPQLARGEMLIVNVAPKGLEIEPIENQYIVTTELESSIADKLSAPDNSGWKLINSNNRRLKLEAGDVDRASGTTSYLQQVSPYNSALLTIPRPEGAYVVTWQRVVGGKLVAANQQIGITELDCSDINPPTIPDKLTSIDVLVYQMPEIDLSTAFDRDSEIMSYFVDTNPDLDSDGDGITDNDRVLEGDNQPRVDTNNDGISDNDANISVFRLRAYDKPGQRTVVAHVVDKSGNRASRKININVKVPDIFVTSVTVDEISGYISPAVANIPISLVRERNGQATIIPTRSSVVKTDNKGRFTVEDGLENQQVAYILDRSQQRIATIGLESGTILASSALKVAVRTEEVGGTAYLLQSPSGTTITQVRALTSALNDVDLYDGQNRKELRAYQGVLVDDLQDSDVWRWSLLAGDDQGYPGGAALTLNNQRRLIITPSGRITLVDQPDIKLQLSKVTNVSQPQWIEVYDTNNNQALARIYLGNKELSLDDLADQLVVRRRPPAEATNEDSPRLPFADVQESDSDYDLLVGLYERGLLSGKNRDGNLVADLDATLSRAEFTSLLLKLSCIIPRDEAKAAPALFADIPYKVDGLEWYYAPIKEAALQGFVTGYQGQIDPASGLPIFLPEANISVAEVAKVILEVLESKNVIDLSKVSKDANPWYLPYLAAAQSEKSPILTTDEAAKPNKAVTRREFFRIVNRVLSFSNCVDLDDDRDGMPFHFEAKYNLNPKQNDANADPDGDGLNNLAEYTHKTNPLDPDTDDGGVGDGIEVRRKTNPLNPRDDLPVVDPNAGVDVTEISCNQCPCPYTLEYGTTVLTTDQFIGIIRDNDGNIVQRSNRYQSSR